MTITPRLSLRTRELLQSRARSCTYQDIADKTGLPVIWISDFNKYPERDHGVNRVETLYTFLTGKPLEL